MFQKLCGDNNFSNLLIGMTWWDKDRPDVIAAREKVLRESGDFWGGMIEKGAKVAKVPFTGRECVDLLHTVSQHGKVTLRIQEEMVLECKPAGETGAAGEMERYKQMQAIRDYEDLEMTASHNRHQEACAREDQRLQSFRAKRHVSFQEKLRAQSLRFQTHVRAMAGHTRQEERRSREISDAYSELKQQCESLKQQAAVIEMERQRSEMAEKHRATANGRAMLHRSTIAHMRQLAFDLELVGIYSENSQAKQRISDTLASDDRQRRASAFCDVCKRHGPFSMDVWCCNICRSNHTEVKAAAIQADPNIKTLADHLTFMADNRDVSDPSVICSECKNTDPGLRSCTVVGHEMTPWRGADVLPGSGSARQSETRLLRAGSAMGDGRCDGCGDICDSVFFGCGQCTDEVNLCIRCVLGEGKGCPGLARGHELDLLMWYPRAISMSRAGTP
jgi:hypothetical protein